MQTRAASAKQGGSEETETPRMKVTVIKTKEDLKAAGLAEGTKLYDNFWDKWLEAYGRSGAWPDLVKGKEGWEPDHIKYAQASLDFYIDMVGKGAAEIIIVQDRATGSTITAAVTFTGRGLIENADAEARAYVNTVIQRIGTQRVGGRDVKATPENSTYGADLFSDPDAPLSDRAGAILTIISKLQQSARSSGKVFFFAYSTDDQRPEIDSNPMIGAFRSMGMTRIEGTEMEKGPDISLDRHGGRRLYTMSEDDGPSITYFGAFERLGYRATGRSRLEPQP